MLCFSAIPPSFLLPSSTLLSNGTPRSLPAAHTPLQIGDSVRYKAPPHLSESELRPWTVFVSLHARDSHSQHLLLTQFSPLSPRPPFILSWSCRIFPTSNFVFFYDSSTNRALIPIPACLRLCASFRLYNAIYHLAHHSFS